ncbi:MAG: TonB-dependent receptor [Flavobacterium sp.]|nr:TonB-dependent receptor [Flavobacterium sp.]
MRFKLIMLFFLVCYSSFGQYAIRGTVTNENNIPLRDTHVHIGNQTTTSNIDGNFLLENIRKGKQKIYISYIGFESITETITINKDTVLNFKLKPSIINLEESIVLQAKNTKTESSNEQVITTQTIEKYSNQTLGNALKEVSGVSILKTGSTIVKPVINGLHSSRVPIINNNVRLEDQQWGTEHAPNFDVNTAGKITVVKGASTLQYGGDAIGGIVIIEPEVIKKTL